MNNDKLICIRDEDDTKLTTLLSDGDGEIYFNYSGCYYDNNTRFRLHTF